MATRWGPGPVFVFEWLRTARRWQVYALRSLFVSLLLIGLAGVWRSNVRNQPALSIAAMARVGEFSAQTIVIIQLALVMLAAPAATAGAICLDKARGALAHLLVTDLSDAEIVLGKLAARLVPVVGLIACAFPVVALGTLLGGIDPEKITAAFAATLGVAVLGCALALTLSVWGKKTHEVLLATYTLWIVLLLAGPFWELMGKNLRWGSPAPEWLYWINPYTMVTAPVSWPRKYDDRAAWMFAAGCLAAAAALTALAIARVRAVTVRQLGEPAKRTRRFTLLGRRPGPSTGSVLEWLPGPSLEGNPVLWREWHRNRPSGWVRLIWGLYIAASILLSLYFIVNSLSGDRTARDMAAVFNGLQVTVGLLMLSVSAANSLAEERARGSLDVLLTTPLPTATIVLGKWWGAFRIVPLLAVLPFWVAAAVSVSTEHFLGPFLVSAITLAYGAALTSLGLALATWLDRPGRATAACVGAYALVTVGAVPLAFLLFRNGHVNCGGFAMASPFYGTGFLTAMIGGTGGPDADYLGIVAWGALWTVVYAGAAAGLLGATLATFDRRLGRITGFPSQPPSRSPKPAADLEWLVLVD